MRFFLPLFIGLSFLANANAQNGSPSTGGARGLAMGNASATFDDINAAYSNQSGLAFLPSTQFGVYAEQRFLTGAINSLNAAVANPFKNIGTLGLTMGYFGFQEYNEQKIGLSYSRLLSNNFAIGAQFDYLSTRIPTYGQASSFTAELGFLYKMSKTVHLGAHAYNFVRAGLPNGDKLPSIYKIGLAYLPSEKVRVNTELEKNIDNPLNFKLGIEYRPTDKFMVRTGFNTAPFRISGGLGIQHQGLIIDAGVNYHQILGFSPALSVSYGLNTPKKQPETVSQ